MTNERKVYMCETMIKLSVITEPVRVIIDVVVA